MYREQSRKSIGQVSFDNVLTNVDRENRRDRPPERDLRRFNSVYMPFEHSNQAQFHTVSTRNGGGFRYSEEKRSAYESSAPVSGGGERAGSPNSPRSSGPGSSGGRGSRHRGRETFDIPGSRSVLQAPVVANEPNTGHGRRVSQFYARRNDPELRIPIRSDSGEGGRRGEYSESTRYRGSSGQGREGLRDRDTDQHGRRRGRRDREGTGREERTNEDHPSEAYRDYRDDDPEDEGSGDGGDDPRDRSK